MQKMHITFNVRNIYAYYNKYYVFLRKNFAQIPTV